LPEASAVVEPTPSLKAYPAERPASMVNDAVLELPLSVAVMVTGWSDVAAPAVAVKFAVVAPAATVADAGTVSAALLSEIATAVPPAGADCDMVTVQVEVLPESTVVGVHCSAVKLIVVVDGVIVTEAVAELPFRVAVTVTAWLVVTVPAVAVKFAVVAPAATVADAGTVSAALLSEIVTAVPPAGAACDMVTVHVELAPEAILAGVHASDDTVTAGAGAVTVTEAVLEVPFRVAVTVTAWLVVTVPAVAVKLAVVAPDATVAEAGTVNAALLSEIATAVPPAGAACDMVTVQVELAPEAMLAGVHASDDTVTGVGAVTVTEAVLELPFRVAVTVTAWLVVTVPAVAVKLAVVAPDATVAEDGTVNAALLSEIATAVPPAGAACEIVTVHVELAPEAMVAGHASDDTVTAGAGAVTVTEAVRELPFKVAVTVTAWLVVTVPAVAVKLAVVAPAATVAAAGTVSAALLSEIATAVPPAGAACDMVTVQVELAPEAMLDGAHANDDTVGTTTGAVTVTEAVLELPFRVAVTVTAWLVVTVPAVAVKLAVMAPAATVADDGTVNAALLSEIATAVPPAGAACDMVTVQVELAPEAMLAGVHASDDTVGGVPPDPPSTEVFISD
jgi:hypothetical protein